MIKIIESTPKNQPGLSSLKIYLSEFNQRVVDIIKSATNPIWVDKEKCWELPCNQLTYLIDNLTYVDEISIDLLDTNQDTPYELICNYKTEPYKYQLDGIKYLLNNNNAILGDPPGLGKTLQIIYAAEELKERDEIEHCLILCGINSLKTNWKKEIERHSKYDCVIIGEKINSKGRVVSAPIKERAQQLYNKINEFFVILNVESLRDSTVIDAIVNSKNNYDMIAFDEVHKASNPTSLQGKNTLKLAKIGKRHIAMTGTLLVNSPLDAYVPLRFIGREKSTYGKFKNLYCIFQQNFGHNELIGYHNIDVLKDQLSSCTLRRSKDILDLPPKTIIPEYLDMTEQHMKFYNDLSNGVIEDADRVNITEQSLLGMVTRLRQASTTPESLTSKEFTNTKLERAKTLIDSIVANNEKVVVFSSFVDPLNNLASMILDYKPLLGTGQLDPQEVSDNIDKFQDDDEHMVFLATTSKCGTGVTLHRAHYAIFLDSVWTAATEVQVEDRIWRIGSKEPVFIYKLICNNTIDERVQKILERKGAMSDYIVDNKINNPDELRELLGLNRN